jgi:hypothetical protein
MARLAAAHLALKDRVDKKNLIYNIMCIVLES